MTEQELNEAISKTVKSSREPVKRITIDFYQPEEEPVRQQAQPTFIQPQPINIIPLPTMNKQLGTKWFTFYTKVRPWIMCLFTLVTVMDFLECPDFYFSDLGMLVYFLGQFANAVLGIAIFLKSSGDYTEFVSLVNKVLIYEVAFVSYSQGIRLYYEDGYVSLSVIAVVVILGLLGYFIWYKEGMKYYMRRLQYKTN